MATAAVLSENRTNNAGELLAAAARGERAAWDAIVDRYGEVVWRVVRGFRFDRATSEDVVQVVWMQLWRNIERIREPERLAGWLGVTARREAINVYRSNQRTLPSEHIERCTQAATWDRDTLVEDEERDAVLLALATLPDDAQRLLEVLAADPPPPYAEIAELLNRPIGSIGPSRARALEKLRRAFEAEYPVSV